MTTAPQIYESITLPGSSSLGATVTAPGTNNTKGAYTTLLASTARDAVGLLLTGQYTRAGGAGFALADIAIGASGSESVIVPNLLFARRSSNNMEAHPVWIPCQIPAGSRISARYQTNDVTNTPTLYLGAQLAAPAPDWPARRYAASADIGSVTASSKGTQIDPGTTANTKGSWVDLSTSCPINARWAILSFTHDTPVDFAWSWRIDIGVGATPQVVYPDLQINSGTNGLWIVRAAFPLHIAAGQAVKMRAASNATNGSRLLTANMQLFG